MGSGKAFLGKQWLSWYLKSEEEVWWWTGSSSQEYHQPFLCSYYGPLCFICLFWLLQKIYWSYLHIIALVRSQQGLSLRPHFCLSSLRTRGCLGLTVAWERPELQRLFSSLFLLRSWTTFTAEILGLRVVSSAHDIQTLWLGGQARQRSLLVSTS